MSVQLSSMYARHSSFGPSLPTSFQPAGGSRSTNQIEYCSSSLTTTLQVLISSFVIVLSLLGPRHARRATIPEPAPGSSREREGDVRLRPPQQRPVRRSVAFYRPTAAGSTNTCIDDYV